MKRITTGKLAAVLRRFFPQVTRKMIRHDADCGKLKVFPSFGEGSWSYVVPEHLPEYLIIEKQVPPEAVREVLHALDLNFKSLAA